MLDTSVFPAQIVFHKARERLVFMQILLSEAKLYFLSHRMSCYCFEVPAFRVENARFFKHLSFDRFLGALAHVHPAADRIIVILRLVSGKQNAAIISYLIIHFEQFSSVNLCQQLRQLILRQQKTQTI